MKNLRLCLRPGLQPSLQLTMTLVALLSCATLTAACAGNSSESEVALVATQGDDTPPTEISQPTGGPSPAPTPAPSANPSPSPTSVPSPVPSATPTPAPTPAPTPTLVPVPVPVPKNGLARAIHWFDFGVRFKKKVPVSVEARLTYFEGNALSQVVVLRGTILQGGAFLRAVNAWGIVGLFKCMDDSCRVSEIKLYKEGGQASGTATLRAARLTQVNTETHFNEGLLHAERELALGLAAGGCVTGLQLTEIVEVHEALYRAVGHCLNSHDRTDASYSVTGRVVSGSGSTTYPAHYLVGYLKEGKPPETVSRLRKTEASYELSGDGKAMALRLWFADEGGINGLFATQ